MHHFVKKLGANHAVACTLAWVNFDYPLPRVAVGAVDCRIQCRCPDAIPRQATTPIDSVVAIKEATKPFVVPLSFFPCCHLQEFAFPFIARLPSGGRPVVPLQGFDGLPQVILTRPSPVVAHSCFRSYGTGIATGCQERADWAARPLCWIAGGCRRVRSGVVSVSSVVARDKAAIPACLPRDAGEKHAY